MKALTELRDEFVKKFLEENWDEDAELMDITRESYEFGFDAAVDLLTKQGVAEFDEEAASDEGYKLNFINAVDSLQNVAFVRGARYQHQQNRAALSAMKSDISYWKEKAIHTLGFSIKIEEELRTEIEKLSAEKANDWKRMDEAKDAFACTVDQLNAAVDQQAIEIDKLRETLSAMKSLATKYRNNCDMLMQHRGVFKDEIEKLRADRAILVRCFEFLVESSQISIFSTEKGSEAFKLYEKLKRDAE